MLIRRPYVQKEGSHADPTVVATMRARERELERKIKDLQVTLFLSDDATSMCLSRCDMPTLASTIFDAPAKIG